MTNETRSYTWVWIGFVLGFFVFAIGAIEMFDKSYSVWKFYSLLALPIALGACGYVIDIKIDRKYSRKSKHKNKNQETKFVLGYAKKASIICLIYSIAVSPLAFNKAGMFSQLPYVILTFPTKLIGGPIDYFFSPVLNTYWAVIINTIILTLEGFLAGFLVPNILEIINRLKRN